MKKINLNSTIKVKLTPFGDDIYYHKHDDLIEFTKERGVKPLERTMPKKDEEGFTKFQLHDFMNTFGKYMTVGQKNVIEDICIYMNDEDIEEVK